MYILEYVYNKKCILRKCVLFMFFKWIISVNTLLRICILKYVNNIKEISLRKCIIFMFCNIYIHTYTNNFNG